MKLPKLYALNALLGIVRSNRETYTLDENGFFSPKTHEDFYFFIKQGFLLSDDPTIKVNSFKINIGMTDEDVLREMALRKGNDIVPRIENDQEFKDQCYKDFFAKVDREVESGEIAGYPSDMSEKAEAYYQEMKAKRIEEMTVPASTIDKTENGPVVQEGDENDEGEIAHYITEEDLKNNPEFVKEGLEVGDLAWYPKDDLVEENSEDKKEETEKSEDKKEDAKTLEVESATEVASV